MDIDLKQLRELMRSLKQFDITELVVSSRRPSSARSTARLRPTRRPSSRCRLRRARGADALHRRGDEAHERDRGRVRRAPSSRSSSRTASPSSSARSSSSSAKADDVQEGPHRESRRDRDAHPARVPRARHAHGGDPLGGRRGRAPRALRRRGRVRGPAGRQELPQHPAIIAAAEITGADAIHPGYGFLSRTPNSPRSAGSAGSPSSAPRPRRCALGRQGHARARRQAFGLPLLPGTGVLGTPSTRIERGASEIGFPVILKASGGGGGRGMRIVRARTRSAAPSRRHARGHGGLQEPGHLPRALRRGAAPHRVPGARRSARPGVDARRARVLAPAPPPEGHRGGAEPGDDNELRAEIGEVIRTRSARPATPRSARSSS
jgi:hypothetical protein